MLKQAYYRALVWVLLGLSGCKLLTDEPTIPTWGVDVVGPIVKAELSISDMVTARGLDLVLRVPADSIGLPKGRIEIVPPLALNTIGPKFTKGLNEAIRSATFAKCRLTISIINGFPLTISPGAVMTIRDKDNNILIRDTLPQAINGSGGSFEKSYPMKMARVTSQLSMTVDNIATPGSFTPITIDETQSLSLSLTVDNIEMDNIELASNSYFEIIDTSEFKLDGQNLDTRAPNGNFFVSLENEMPVTYQVQAYYLDAQYRVVDSLFNTAAFTIKNAITDANGKVQTPTLSRSVIQMNQARLDRIKSAKYFRSFASVQAVYIPTGEDVRVLNTQLLDLRVLGDMKVDMKLGN